MPNFSDLLKKAQQQADAGAASNPSPSPTENQPSDAFARFKGVKLGDAIKQSQGGVNETQTPSQNLTNTDKAVEDIKDVVQNFEVLSKHVSEALSSFRSKITEPRVEHALETIVSVENQITNLTDMMPELKSSLAEIESITTVRV